MITARSHPKWAWSKLLNLLFVTCLALLSTSAIATANTSRPAPVARISAASQALDRAAAASNAADRALVRDAKALRACQLKHPKHCKAAANAVQRAGHRYAISERNIARLAHSGGRGHAARSTSAATQAPQITVSGQTLSWTRPGGVSTFVFVRKVPGQEDQYSIVRGSSATPPPVPGYTVLYSVRTNVSGSVWATAKSIAYAALAPVAITPPSITTTSTEPVPPTTTPPTATTPPPTSTTPPTTPTPPTTTTPPPTTTTPPPITTPTPTPAPTPPTDPQTAPIITVSSQKLTWTQIGSVNTYVFVRKVPGQEDQYSMVSGTSITPPAVPGSSVRYSVRTAVEGSAWAPEVVITYSASEPQPEPTEPAPQPKPEPTPEPTPSEPAPPVTQPSAGPFEMGVVAGSALEYERPFIEKLGAHTARMEVSIDTPASQIASTVEAYAKAGIRPLLLASFYGTLPSPSEAKNLAGWAKEFGPGGTLWQGRSFPAATAVTSIEFGNETSYTYQYSDNSTAGYESRAQTYALRLKEAQEAIQATGVHVGLLAQGDTGDGHGWVPSMFKAVPDLSQRVAGWTIHPYGPEWQSRIDTLIATTQAAGAPDTVPVYVTEWGLDTDNGHCLEYNFGWNKCMTYSEAASVLGTAVNAMKAHYGSRLAAVYLYEAHDQNPSGTSTSLESSFGALQSNGAPKGAYTTEVQSLLTANP